MLKILVTWVNVMKGGDIGYYILNYQPFDAHIVGINTGKTIR
jgi:hypothetical protein